MTKENRFTKKFNLKTDAELLKIVNNRKLYDEKAIQAAIWILESRNLESPEIKPAQEEIINKVENKKESYMKLIGIPFNTVSRVNRFLHSIIDSFIIFVLHIGIAYTPLWKYDALNMLLLFPIYYIIFEFKFQQTPGKMVTETIVVDKFGNKPNLKTIILRTAARYVPFEALSCIATPSYGWHDKWTETYVIDKKDLATLKK